MNEEEKQSLMDFFGPGFSDEELESIARDHPDLLRELPWMKLRLHSLREGPAPQLGEAFTRRVMENLEQRFFWKEWSERWLNWRGLVFAGSLAAATLAGVFLMPRIFLGPDAPVATRDEILPGAGKTYLVGFKIRIPGAQSVAVAGDFNQWNPVELKASEQGDGDFTVNLPLAAGTYTYAFLVDGKNWIPDPTVPGKVEDGFGNYNSLLNL